MFLYYYKCEWLEIFEKEEGSLTTCVEESFKERDNKDFEKGLDSKVKLEMFWEECRM